ncbi:hypothetical protein C0J52_12549 [Blattella germanica]|nr:hypothetical protein C0J52_12549 [Blattella germanica]
MKTSIGISCFPKVISFLKKKSVGYKPNQSKSLSRAEVNRFMREASDKEHLLTKVVAMIGVAGGCRRDEFYSMTVGDVQDTGSQLIITIPQTKTNQRRISVINDGEGLNFLEFYRKYISLRPKELDKNFLFVGYRNGKCVNQRVGIHMIGGMPKKIASFLGLPNIEMYTGHCFRRTSATLLANAGADVSVLKRHGGGGCGKALLLPKSRNKVALMIQGGKYVVEVLQAKGSVTSTSQASDMPSICVMDNINSTININME